MTAFLASFAVSLESILCIPSQLNVGRKRKVKEAMVTGLETMYKSRKYGRRKLQSEIRVLRNLVFLRSVLYYIMHGQVFK